jgi:cell wall-associated NlpC family hydrolase
MPFSATRSSLDRFGARRIVSRLAASLAALCLVGLLDASTALAAPTPPAATPAPASAVPMPAMAPVVPDPNAKPTPAPAAGPAAAAPTSTTKAPLTAKDGSATSPVTEFRVTATDQEGLRVRSAPSLSAPIIAKIPEGTIVALGPGVATEADDERWLPVKVDQDTRGWVAARYLVRVQALAPVAKTVGPNASFGDKVAATAAAYIGQPYVWGGNAPGGFDCSGLVQWVFSKTGFEMPRLIPDQLAAGKKVPLNALQPGDVLAFENTYRPGLSHVGIYIGNDNFIHASDEAHGVMISSLQEDYWKERIVMAVRIK